MIEFDTAEIEKTMTEIIEGMRPPAHVRDEVDLGFRLIKQSVEVFEVRSFWDEPKRRIKCPIAKATFVKKQGVWKKSIGSGPAVDGIVTIRTPRRRRLRNFWTL